MLRMRAWPREIFFLALVFSAYFGVSFAASDRAALAMDHCRDLIALERSLGIFVELGIQQAVLGTPVAALLDPFYTYIHSAITICLLAGMFLSGHERYAYVRNVFVVFSLISFLIYFVYPSAPPRMMEEYGFVDTADQGPSSSQTDLLRQVMNPYAAMPSVHFGYSIIVAGSAIALFKRDLLTVPGVVYPALMIFVLTASANHLLIDCIASVPVLLASFLLVDRFDLAGRLARYLRF